MMGPDQQGPVFRAHRRAALRRHARLIGLDYIEVASPMQLLLFFVPAAESIAATKVVRPEAITPANIRVQGATGREQIRLTITAVRSSASAPQSLEVALRVEGGEGEIPVFTLELVDVPNLDPFFTQASFSLEPLDRPSPVDPRVDQVPSAPGLPAPEIDYLARDFGGLRRLLLNRLSLLMPGWQESHPADLGHTLVEILAYAADQLSYYQDAVATEAYLGTARQRVSIKRHARLIDYAMHEGCNARVWIHLTVQDAMDLPAGTALLTRVGGVLAPTLSTATYTQALSQGATGFETMHDIRLVPAHNAMDFYTWGRRDFVVPQGATSATLRGTFPDLQPGQVVLLEAIRGAETVAPVAANPTQRHAVRLTAVLPGQDELGAEGSAVGVPITSIVWSAADALPFPLPVAAADCAGPLSVARGNMVLADHGHTLVEEDLQPPTVPDLEHYQPRLQRTDLTFSVPYHHEVAVTQPAAMALTQDPRQTTAAIKRLVSTGAGPQGQEEGWFPQRDLLTSDRFTPAFVVERETDGRAQLRFGDGVYGKQPASGSRFQATYRVGNGPQGNVGQDTIAHLVADAPEVVTAVSAVRNPLAAQGGTAPEALAQVRLYAPRAFHTQERCVTEADYVAVAERHPEVQKAAAFLRWTGSWYTAVVVVDRQGGRPADAAFQGALLAMFPPYRLAGYDITIRAPFEVALDLALTVHVAPTHAASTVKQALLEAFSSADLPNGRQGFFHPEQFTIGQPVYLSQIITRAMQVPGVVQVEATRFQRLGRPPQDELREGRILLGPFEVVRMSSAPDLPHRGQITLTVQGGREVSGQ
jgi:hypothetical protein